MSFYALRCEQSVDLRMVLSNARGTKHDDVIDGGANMISAAPDPAFQFSPKGDQVGSVGVSGQGDLSCFLK
ncbi:hypothetical protein B0G38_000380 [Arthrobacter sp. VKM Ac-2550]|nr:hypothetical protein [Arthrobacter sp. VKM Ac-2550]